MRFSLFDAPEREPSQFMGYAGNLLDRQSEKRGDDSVALALADDHVRLLLMRDGRLLLRKAGGAHEASFDLAWAKELGALLDGAVLLGVDGTGPVVAAPAGMDLEALPETIEAVDCRSILMQGLLGAADIGAMAQASALLAWHRTHRFCGRCGYETEMRAGGYKRHCPACAAEHFPRTDPVAIMLAVTRDRCILGRGAHFAPGIYSALAGFIEPGETIEAAVRRETLEEAGVRLGRVVYHASQPWPFPYSLMIGCFGEALDEAIVPDTAELEDCRWFSRADVVAMLAGVHPDGVVVPPEGAIAHHLIRFWAENG